MVRPRRISRVFNTGKPQTAGIECSHISVSGLLRSSANERTEQEGFKTIRSRTRKVSRMDRRLRQPWWHGKKMERLDREMLPEEIRLLNSADCSVSEDRGEPYQSILSRVSVSPWEAVGLVIDGHRRWRRDSKLRFSGYPRLRESSISHAPRRRMQCFPQILKRWVEIMLLQVSLDFLRFLTLPDSP